MSEFEKANTTGDAENAAGETTPSTAAAPAEPPVPPTAGQPENTGVTAEPAPESTSEPTSAAASEPTPEPPTQQPYAAPYGAPYGAYPPPYGGQPHPGPYYYGAPMPNPYPPTPPKRKMPLGLRVLVIVMSVLLAGSTVGFAVYGVYTAMTAARTSIFDLPVEPEPSQGPDEANPEAPDSTEDGAENFTELPDIDVTPNTEGITLHSTPTGEELTPNEVYNKVLPSTVLVITTDSSVGTGIFATEDGYIITNSHVIMNSKSVAVQVKTTDGTLHDAVVVGYDKTTDLAVLKIDGTGYTPAEFGNSDELYMGQTVLAIGNPGGELFSGSLTSGMISGLDRVVDDYSNNGMTYIQTDAAINPGNSGGPLVNMYGQVIGINSAKIVSEQYEGMGFAIPINGAKTILDDLLAGGYVQGRVRFGIKGIAVTEMEAAMYEVPVGFMIHEIDSDSCFVGTDVQVYDIITAIDGVETPTLEALSDALLAYEPGDTVQVSLFRPNESGRGGEAFEVTISLLEDKGETQS